jgi:hypothetical protein
MRHIPQHDCSCCRSLVVSYPKDTAIEPEHVGVLGQQFRENARAVVVGLPDLVLRAIDEDVLLDGVTVHVQEHYEPVLELCLEIYDQIF